MRPSSPPWSTDPCRRFKQKDNCHLRWVFSHHNCSQRRIVGLSAEIIGAIQITLRARDRFTRLCNQALPRLWNTHKELDNGFFLLLPPQLCPWQPRELQQSSARPLLGLFLLGLLQLSKLGTCWSDGSGGVGSWSQVGSGLAGGDNFPSLHLNSPSLPFCFQNIQEVEGKIAPGAFAAVQGFLQ